MSLCVKRVAALKIGTPKRVRKVRILVYRLEFEYVGQNWSIQFENTRSVAVLGVSWR